MLDEFETYLRKEKRYAEHTTTAYLTDLRFFIEFSTIQNNLSGWKEVTHHMVRSWLVSMLDEKMSPSSANRKLSSLRTFFKWLEKYHGLERNPMARVKGPKASKRLPEFVKEKEIQVQAMESLFTEDYEGYRDRLLFEVFYQTGMRLSECIGLKETDLNRGSLKVLGKRNKERIISISAQLYEDLSRLIEWKHSLDQRDIHLFLTDKGVKMYPKFVYRKINYYLSKVTGISKQSPHVLRHSFATHMLNNGVEIEVLKEILGHANLAATQVYTHNSFARLNEIYQHAHPRERKT
jgi:integrase/recombinase XerC